MQNDLITQLILARGLVKPQNDPDAAILTDEPMLAAVAGAWRTSAQPITTVIKSRLYKIEQEMIGNATPAEVIIFRQAMLEVASIYDDFVAYEAEFTAREKSKNAPDAPEPKNETSPAETPIADEAPAGTETSTQSSM